MRAPIRTPGKRTHCWTRPDKEWLVDQYVLKGKSINQIAKGVGADWIAVASWLDSKDIPRRNMQQACALRGASLAGDNSPSWRGGRSRGYILKTAESVLRVAGVSRVCAESGFHWGQLEIHHKDGDETNNVLENLEYLCKSHHWYKHNI